MPSPTLSRSPTYRGRARPECLFETAAAYRASVVSAKSKADPINPTLQHARREALAVVLGNGVVLMTKQRPSNMLRTLISSHVPVIAVPTPLK